MREFQQKTSARKFLSSPIVLSILAAALFFVTKGTWSIYKKNYSSKSELSAAALRLVKLEERDAVLEQSVKKLNTESGLEEEIRDRFQVAKEGEQEIVIVDKTDFHSEDQKPPLNFLQRIWNFFTIR